MSWTWTALVKSRWNDGSYSFGTGFAVKPGWLLTAKHVLQTDINPPEVIVFWEHSNEEGFLSSDRDGGFKEASEILEHPDLDVALIRCNMPKDIACASIATTPHQPGRFDSEGYPTGAKYNDAPTRLRVPGHAHAKDGSKSTFQVTLDDDPNDVEDWRGLSGGPIVLDGAGLAIGIFEITRRVMNNARTAWAVPVHSLLENNKFREILRDTPTDQSIDPGELAGHRSHMRKLLVDAIQDLHLADLSSLLGREASLEASDPKSFQECCEQACNWLTKSSPNDAWHQLREIHKVLDADQSERKSALVDLSTLVAAYSLDDRTLSQVLFLKCEKDAADGFVVAETAHTMIGVELSAASIDGLVPDFHPGEGKGGAPYGTFAMPFVTPEAGPEASDEYLGVIEDLKRETGLSVIPKGDLIPEIDAYLANDRQLVNGPDLLPGEVLNRRASGSLRRQLARYRDDGKRSYYLTVVWPEDEALRAELREKLIALRTQYPSILILSLGTDEDQFELEDEHYGRLISTIKDD